MLKKTVRVLQFVPGHRIRAKLSHSFSRVARRNLPSAPPSRAFSQDLLRRWERAAREQTIMCNQAAGLSRCLTRVQDSMNSQLKTLRLDSKRKSSEKVKQAVSELEYLTTFNRSVSQAMARTMQDLSEAVFINMANFTLARRDSYLDYFTCWGEARHCARLENVSSSSECFIPGPAYSKS